MMKLPFGRFWKNPNSMGMLFSLMRPDQGHRLVLYFSVSVAGLLE